MVGRIREAEVVRGDSTHSWGQSNDSSPPPSCTHSQALFPPHQRHPVSFLSLGPAPRLLCIPESLQVSSLSPSYTENTPSWDMNTHTHRHTHAHVHTLCLLGRNGTMGKGEGSLVPIPGLGSSTPRKELHEGPLAPIGGDKWRKEGKDKGDPRARMPSQWVWEARCRLFSQPQRARKSLEERGSRGRGMG